MSVIFFYTARIFETLTEKCFVFCTSLLYADDAVIRLFLMMKNVHNEHQNALNKTAKWLKQNKLILANKTKTLIEKN